jgi:cation-transporting ATPase G
MTEEHEGHEGAESLWHVRAIRLAIGSGIALGAGFLAERAGLVGVSVVAYAVALLVGGASFAPEAVRGMLRGSIGIGGLMTIAAVGAVLLGEIAEAAMLAFLFSISEGLEGYAMSRTSQELRSLLDLVPPTAIVRRDGVESSVPVAELVVGDRLIVRPGERVVTDGVIVSGRSSLDVSAITGESIPLEAGAGDAVYAGTVNGSGALEVDATASVANNTLARIVQIVEAARDDACERARSGGQGHGRAAHDLRGSPPQ